jgi:ppGpp synthetase/RelA/SpoT-type nucleotidyltranferase
LEAGEKKPEDWGEIFDSRRSAYVSYTQSLELLFRQLLEKNEIPYVQIEARTKEVSNFVSKLRRKNYGDPLEEVTDFSGIRIVLYYLDDVERVGEMIAQQFAVDDENSVDKRALMDPDRFGYLSVHYVVQTSSKRKALPEWSEFADLWAEVQVRTVLQHAWGAISRKLAYASIREAPRDLQRSLNRLSALLELADEQFLDIREAREQIEKQYDREVERGNLDLEIDESSLGVYLREAGYWGKIASMASETGSPTPDEKRAQYKEPPWTAEEEEQMLMRHLLSVLDEMGVTRISELDAKLRDLLEVAPDFVREVNEKYADRGDGQPIAAEPLNWLLIILLWSAQTPAEKLEELGYVDRLVDLVTSMYGSAPN